MIIIPGLERHFSLPCYSCNLTVTRSLHVLFKRRCMLGLMSFHAVLLGMVLTGDGGFDAVGVMVATSGVAATGDDTGCVACVKAGVNVEAPCS